MIATPVRPGTSSDASAFVAAELHPTAAAPEPLQRIGFIKALLLSWFHSRRYGPHLAVGSLRRAMAAHTCAVLIFMAAVAWCLLRLQGGWHFNPHRLRVELAEFILKQASSSSRSDLHAALFVGFVPLVEFGLLLLGTALTPWCAAGDRASSAWRRSVKNVYWATTILIPSALFFGTVVFFDLVRWRGPVVDDVTGTIMLLVGMILPVLFLRYLFVGANRYVGPPDGPAFSPREPRCESCGYVIIGLPYDTKCPECALPIRDSLPGGRRTPTPWHINELRPRGFIELIKLQFNIMRRREFFERLPVHEGLTAARHFWWGTFIIMTFVVLLVIKAAALTVPDDRVRGDLYNSFLVVPVIVLVMQSAVMFMAGLWSQTRLGILDNRISAIVCYYASPLLWPVAILLLAGIALMLDPIHVIIGNMTLPVLGRYLFVPGVVCLAAFAAAIAFWWIRLSAALRAVRFANV